jgi:hypothetical protein
VTTDEEEFPVQKIAAQQVAKRIYDSVMAPAKVAYDTERATEEAEPAPAIPDLHGQTVRDDSGAELGVAHRLSDIAVYLVFDGYGSPRELFDRLVEDPGTRLYVQRDERGRITGLLYAPDPSRLPQRPAGLRADEV